MIRYGMAVLAHANNPDAHMPFADFMVMAATLLCVYAVVIKYFIGEGVPLPPRQEVK